MSTVRGGLLQELRLLHYLRPPKIITIHFARLAGTYYPAPAHLDSIGTIRVYAN